MNNVIIISIMKSIFLSGLGIVLLLLSTTLTSVDWISVIVPAALGALYFLCGVGVILISEKTRIVLVSTSIPLLSVLAFILDSHIGDVAWAVRDSRGNPINDIQKTFWFTGGGVCTESTFCWLWGQILPVFLSIISIAYGILKIGKISIQKS